MRSKYIVAALTAALSIVSVSSIASAEENVSFHANGGVGAAFVPPLNTTLTNNKFDATYNETAEMLFNLGSPYVAIGPLVSASYLPYHNSGNQSTSLWGFGGALRLQTNRDAAASFYGEVQGGETLQVSNAANPFVGAQLGLDISMEPTRTFFVGPYIQAAHLFDVWRDAGNQTELTSFHDTTIATAGVSFSWDLPIHPVVHTNTVVETKTVQSAPVVQAVIVPGEPVVCPPAAAQFSMADISFAKDSGALSANVQSALTDIAGTLNTDAGKNYTVTIEGKASSDGNADYNLRLAYQRANAVVAFLVAHGVDASRLTSVSAGPVGSAGDAANRSADFIVIAIRK